MPLPVAAVAGMWVTLLAVAGGVVVIAALVVGATELTHWAASRRHFAAHPRRSARNATFAPHSGSDLGSAAETSEGVSPETTAGLREVLLVLGCPSARDGSIQRGQKWRTEIAVRSMSGSANGLIRILISNEARRADGADGADGASDQSHAGTLLIFSGAATRGAPVAEAEVMARYAREVLGVPADRIALETRALTTRQNIAFAMGYLEAAATIKIVSNPVHAARARQYLGELRPDLLSRVVPADDYRPLEKTRLKLGTVAYEVTRPVLRHVMPPLRAWHQERTRSRAGRAAG